MNRRRQYTRLSLLTVALVALTSTLAPGCGSDPEKSGSEDPTRRPLDHAEVSNASRMNLQHWRSLLERAGDVLEGQTLAQHFELPSAGGLQISTANDAQRFVQRRQIPSLTEIVRFVEDKVFVPGNVVEDGETQVDYLMSEDVVCAPSQARCRRNVRDLEIRARALSQREDGFEVEVTVSHARISLGTLRLLPDELSFSADLVQLREALGFIEGELDAHWSLPVVMKGAATITLRDSPDERLVATLSVDSPIDVQDDDFSITLGAADPALFGELQLDRADLLIDVSMPHGQLRSSNRSWVYDASTDDYELVEDRLELRFDAIDTLARLPLRGRAIEVEGLSFGDGPLAIYGNGAPEASLTLNSGHGAQFKARAESTSSGVEWGVEPTFDIALDMKFQAIRRELPSLAEWTKDERLQLVLQAEPDSAPVLLRSSSRGVTVEQGSMRLSARSADVSHDVATGECLYEASSGSSSAHWVQSLVVGASCP